MFGVFDSTYTYFNACFTVLTNNAFKGITITEHIITLILIKGVGVTYLPPVSCALKF